MKLPSILFCFLYKLKENVNPNFIVQGDIFTCLIMSNSPKPKEIQFTMTIETSI